MLDLKTKEWNESYARMENVIFYPHEEMVRFLNRFIRKRLSQNKFLDVIYQGDFYHSGIGITQNKSTSIKNKNVTGGGEVKVFKQIYLPRIKRYKNMMLENLKNLSISTPFKPLILAVVLEDKAC